MIENNYLYIDGDTWNWCDGVFSGIATLEPDRVLEYCLEQAEGMRHSDYANYDNLSAKERERLAKLWEEAVNLPEGRYECYFNLENKNEVFIQAVKELAARLCIKYDLILKED